MRTPEQINRIMLQDIIFLGEIPSGLPSVLIPPFGFTKGNETTSFVDMVSAMGSGVIVVPLIALLENIAICKAFGKIKNNFAYAHKLIFYFYNQQLMESKSMQPKN